MTIDVTDQFIVHTGQSFGFTDEIGFLLSSDAGPTLVNKGVISVEATAAIENGVIGVMAYPATNAFVWNRAGASIDVHADADATTSVWGVEMQGDNAHLRNDGDITVQGNARTYGVVAQGGDSFRLDNSGHIDARSEGGVTAVLIRDGSILRNTGEITAEGHGAAGVFALSNSFGPTHIINQGLIQATGDNATGLWLGNLVDGLRIDNDGRIIASSATSGGPTIGVVMSDAMRLEPNALNNTGLIRATTAIMTSGGTDADTFILNAGKIVGDIHLASEFDRVSNTGLIHGDVDLGYGDDVFDGTGGRLIGSLVGGLGADTLTGGLGADSFRYDQLADSTLASSDLIQNLQKIDIIDLSRIDADPTTDGQQHLTAGQVTLTFDSASGNTWLEVDVGGEAGPEMRIVISGDHTDFTGIVL